MNVCKYYVTQLHWQCPFAYATNGTGIIEFDFLTGHESQLAEFPTPADLWARYRQGQKLGFLEKTVDDIWFR
jgi:type I site-specific restriction endonuclease